MSNKIAILLAAFITYQKVFTVEEACLEKNLRLTPLHV
jgi:hypothetical protein